MDQYIGIILAALLGYVVGNFATMSKIKADLEAEKAIRQGIQQEILLMRENERKFEIKLDKITELLQQVRMQLSMKEDKE